MKNFKKFCFGIVLLSGCTERPLTGSEAAFLGSVHGGNVNYDSVIIRRGGLADARPNTGGVAVGYTIHYNSETYRDNFIPEDDVSYLEDLMLLAHEVTHIWQYNSGKTPNCTVASLAREHIDFGDEVYNYPKPLSPSKKFTSYRCEQQAQIVEDWVLARAYNDPKATTYERVIRHAMPIDELIAQRVLLRRK